MSWFEVDRGGLKQLLEGKDPSFIVRELVQNAWDEPGVTRVDVKIRHLGRRRVELTVEDDAPEGFYDLRHAYTLYAHTRKRSQVTKRGRFNLGEKEVLALCQEASIVTTKGGVSFQRDGKRKNTRTKRATGSCFQARLALSRSAVIAMHQAMRTFLPPASIVTTVNGEKILHRDPVTVVHASLATEFENGEGEWRATERQTEVHVHEPLPGERAMIYEMGLPVVETGDRWHYDVQQRVPLNSDRDNVKPSFLRDVRAEVANVMREDLTKEDVAEKWVHDAMEDDRITPETVSEVTTRRFGEKRVVADPNDPRSREKAIAAGYAIVASSSMSKAEWANVREVGAVPSSSSLFPTTFVDGHPVPKTEWNEDMRRVVRLVKKIGLLTIGYAPTVRIVKAESKRLAADFGAHTLTFNLTSLGKGWFKRSNLEWQLKLIIHELGHEYGGHINQAYYDGLAMIGAVLAMTDPKELET